MPTYDYKCEACGYSFERFHSMSAEPVKRCPECGKAKVKRLLGTGAGLIFKGSGFYITDYRDKSYKDAASKDRGASNGSTTAKSGSSDKTATAGASPSGNGKAGSSDAKS